MNCRNWALRALWLGVWAAGAVAAQAAPVYQVTDLGTLGGSESIATGINRLGWVVGFSTTAGDPYHAFLWQGGCMTSLGTLVPGGESFASGINLSGQVSGSATAADGSNHAVVFWGGEVQDIGALRDDWVSSSADAINRQGHVVGQATVKPAYASMGFVYARGRVHMLAEGSRPHAINDHDQITGAVGNMAFVGSLGNLTDMGTLGGSWAEGMALNNAGQVTGWAATPHDSFAHAFLWQDGAMTDLGSLGGWQSQGKAIDKRGTVVGWSTRQVLDGKHAFRTLKGQMVDLNGLLDPVSGKGWELIEASGIDDAGHIVGFGIHKGFYHGFLLTPMAP